MIYIERTDETIQSPLKYKIKTAFDGANMPCIAGPKLSNVEFELYYQWHAVGA